jgi:hypothetical protein
MLTAAFLSMMALTAVVNASESFASDAHRVDVIDAIHETVAQVDSVKAGGEQTRVDVIDSIGPEGPGYSYTKPMSH